ncbi:MAG: hypothetical protein GY832_10190 [Chloroflexi bacterium]|nr:hypothetical protein [Chloroflexota bacterium]
MTKCIASNEIEPWQLDAYRDGVRDPAVIAHIRRCPACAHRIATPEPVDNRLSAALFRFTCPTVDDLMNYHWGFLSQGQAANVAKHLVDCPHCAKEVAQFAPYLLARDQVSQTTPPLFEQLHTFVARLLPSQLALAPVRAGQERATRGPAPTTQSYTIDDLEWDLILNWTPGPGAAFTLQGQLFGPTADEMVAAQAKLKQAEIALTAPLDADGLFSISPVPPGEYALYFYTPQNKIQIPNIKLA